MLDKMEMPRMYLRLSVRLGDLFRKLSRYFYSHSSGVCWNCGSRCGMGTIARGLMWCDHCYERWHSVIASHEWEIDWTGLGYKKEWRKK
jgi:hypothetical protein